MRAHSTVISKRIRDGGGGGPSTNGSYRISLTRAAREGRKHHCRRDSAQSVPGVEKPGAVHQVTYHHYDVSVVNEALPALVTTTQFLDREVETTSAKPYFPSGCHTKTHSQFGRWTYTSPGKKNIKQSCTPCWSMSFQPNTRVKYQNKLFRDHRMFPIICHTMNASLNLT